MFWLFTGQKMPLHMMGLLLKNVIHFFVKNQRY